MPQFAKSLEGITGSAIRDLFKLLCAGDVTSFGGGNPSASSFPVSQIKNILDELIEEKGSELLQYAATEGYAPLRAAVSEHMLKPRGVFAPDSCILPTTGSSQAIDLICRAYIDPGDAVLVESPTFLGALQTIRISGAKLVSVPGDAEGVLPDELERLMALHRPKLFYCIPTFQNPSGRTLGLARRKRIAELAQAYDVLVVEDDPYYALRYRGEEVAPIKSFDADDHVMLLNSFSKTMSPGMRVGVAVGPADALRKMVILKQGCDAITPPLMQAVAAEFLARGLMPAQLARIRPEYARRLDAMLDAIDAHFPAACVRTKPEGGLFVWIECPGLDTLALLPRATCEAKVAYIPGVHFYAEADAPRHTLRLNFSGCPIEDIPAGLERLGNLMKDELARGS
ncbi:MAG TPA: PLP-dependent aminotransferase family protein [Clostridia bacterium]|nr:PLP-dependent aminotransferase family protein [Clostridia bacterium]